MKEEDYQRLKRILDAYAIHKISSRMAIVRIVNTVKDILEKESKERGADPML